MASLPSNASRSYKDPFGKPARWPWAVLAAALLAGAAVAWLWFNPPYWNKLFDKTPLVQHSKAQKTPDTREQGQSPLPVNATRANATRQTNK